MANDLALVAILLTRGIELFIDDTLDAEALSEDSGGLLHLMAGHSPVSMEACLLQESRSIVGPTDVPLVDQPRDLDDQICRISRRSAAHDQVGTFDGPGFRPR